MIAWTNDELNNMSTTDELELASLRSDGTLRRPVTIWDVRVGDDLYVRAVNGRSGVWFRGAQARHEGHIRAGGVDKDVAIAEVAADDPINGQIDAAYRAKYRRYAANIVNSVVTPQARAATLKVVPR